MARNRNYRLPRVDITIKRLWGVAVIEVKAAVVTSWRVLFIIPSQNIAKLLGFTMDEDPIIEADSGQEMVHTLQVHDRPSQQFHNVGIEDNSDLHLTPVLRSSSNTRVEPSSSTSNPVKIILGPAGIAQQAKLLKENVFILDSDRALMSTQEYMQKVVEYVGDIENNLKKRKLDHVVAIVKSCSLNVLGDLTVTMKDLSGTIPGTIHYKVIGDGGYGKDINVGAAMILYNVLFFTPKASNHYLNITMRNLVKVFRKYTVS
nr:hypothetical protein [Tanacetum cinerariifolium]